MTAPALRELIDGWMQTADWDSSQAYLRAHASAMLTDEAQALLRHMAAEQTESPDAEVHADLLSECRATGIEAGYAAVLEALASEEDAALLRALIDVRDMARAIEWAALSLPADTELAAFEFWEQRFLGLHSQQLGHVAAQVGAAR